MRKTIDDVFAMCDSRYALVSAIARKARWMADEAEKKKLSLSDKPVNLVIKCLMEGSASVCEKDENEVDVVFDEDLGLLD